MKIGKRGGGLAVRIPVEILRKVGIEEGDEATVTLTEAGVIEIRFESRREKALRWICENRIKLPDDYTFNRGSIYDE